MPLDGPISFARGAPSPDIVPAESLRRSANKVLKEDPAGAFSYGKATGYEPLRQWIAEKHGVGVDQVLITNGSMQADAFLFDLLVDSGDEVVIEAPTYDRTLLSLQQHGANLLAIPLQQDGIDPGAVETALLAGARPKLAHIIPNFHNPAGCTLSLEKRRELLELASRHRFLIFEDDPYVELRFEGEDVPTMLSLDSNAAVIYASSFSKTVCPGIRVGYLVGPADSIAQIATLATNTYISPSMVSQAIVAEFCRSGEIDASVETVKRALRERRDALTEALRSELPQARFIVPEGGYFLWVELPDEIDVNLLATAAADEGVTFVKGTDFLLEGGNSSLRLAYSGVTPAQITEGIKRLARALAPMCAQD